VLITFTGDVIEVRSGFGTWLITLTDRTSGVSAAQKVKTGQVMEVVGWVTRQRTVPPVIPFVLRAKNGTNEADINAITAAYTQDLINSTDRSKLEAEIVSLKGSLQAAENRMNNAKSDLTRALADVEPLKEENERLRATAEQLDRDLQYERLLKGVMGGS
jgi:aspartyl-tRNA synthetase